MTHVFWISVALLLATWIFYPAVLCVLAWAVPRNAPTPPPPDSAAPAPIVTVLIAAHNEEKNIEQRLLNILQTAPANAELDVLVVSDGSTDRTVALAQAYAATDPRVRVIETSGSRGKVTAHNQGMKVVRGDITVFTDAETEFAPEFLDHIVSAFDDPEVGFASGELVWRNRSGGITGENFSLYWQYEVLLRKLETRIGVHAIGTGACSAVRTSLYRPIAPQADQDFITPLDSVLQGYRTVFVPEAKAYDYVGETPAGEFKARVRMTAKNFLNTFTHWGTASYWRHPAESLGLIFHKLFRWLTPFFVLGALLSGLFVTATSGSNPIISTITILMLLAIAYGLLGSKYPKLPLAGSLWSFMLANVAFAIGVLRALSGRAPTAFR